MNDGDAHPLAIQEILAIAARGGDLVKALGALAKKRHQAIASGALDAAFERHDRSNAVVLYSVNHCVGRVGTTAVFSLVNGALRLLSVVAFDDLIVEAMSASALYEALGRAEQRI
jgi:hypothetical protein